MGVRFRKSINLGGGFRVNLSKTGIGYSWGIKGYRVTKTGKGTTRTTVSIPGTGISYVHENGKNNKSIESKQKSQFSPPATSPIDKNHYGTTDITNNVASEMVSDGLEDILSAARKAIKIYNNTLIGFIVTLFFGFAFPPLLLISIILLGINIYVRTKGTIELEYNIDPDQQAIVDQRMNQMIKIASCAKVWRIVQTSNVIDRKYSSGANETISRKNCRTATQPPFPFKTNVNAAVFKTGKETLLFLPDKLFIIQGDQIGALNYNDISCSNNTTKFIEREIVPQDTQVIGQTWKYVNKSGGPDKRFKDNCQIPICLYGELKLSSASGLNTTIMYSNPSIDIQ